MSYLPMYIDKDDYKIPFVLIMKVAIVCYWCMHCCDDLKFRHQRFLFCETLVNNKMNTRIVPIVLHYLKKKMS